MREKEDEDWCEPVEALHQHTWQAVIRVDKVVPSVDEERDYPAPVFPMGVYYTILMPDTSMTIAHCEKPVHSSEALLFFLLFCV